MPDNPHLVAQDKKLISMSEDYEVRDWCKTFACTKAELQAAVDKAGHSAKAVRLYFEKNPPKK